MVQSGVMESVTRLKAKSSSRRDNVLAGSFPFPNVELAEIRRPQKKGRGIHGQAKTVMECSEARIVFIWLARLSLPRPPTHSLGGASVSSARRFPQFRGDPRNEVAIPVRP